MVTSAAYDKLVQDGLAKRAAEREIKGNLSSKTMTPQECETEIKAIVPGYIGTSGSELDAIAHTIETGDIIAPVVKVTRAELMDAYAPLREKNKDKIAVGLGMHKCEICGDIEPNGARIVHEIKKKRGRPKGSLNRPKVKS